MPIPAHSITHLKPDGLSLSFCLSPPRPAIHVFSIPSPERARRRSSGGIKTDKTSQNICPSRLRGHKTRSKLQQLACDAVCFLALMACHVRAQSAGFIIAFLVWSGAEAENTASLTGERSRVGLPARQEFNVLITLTATGAEKFPVIQTHHTLPRRMCWCLYNSNHADYSF